MTAFTTCQDHSQERENPVAKASLRRGGAAAIGPCLLAKGVALTITTTEAPAGASTPAQTSARAIVAWIVAAQAVLLVVALWYLWTQVSYLGDPDSLTILSSQRGDKPPVPNVPWMFGVHTFGDFILPYEQALVPNPWTDYPMMPYGNAYPPVLMLVFKLFTFLPYPFALGLFIALNVASMAIPVIAGARRCGVSQTLVALCLLVFMSFPLIMVVDRGNAQGLLVLPLYVFAVAWRERRWRRAVVALSIAIALKLYPALLAIVFLAERRFRAAALAVGAAAAVTLVLFDLYPHGLSATLQGFRGALLPFSTTNTAHITISNYSVLGMLANLGSALFGVESAPVNWLRDHPSLAGYLYLAAAAAVVCARRLPFVVRLACALSVMTFALPIAYGYTLSFVVIVVAELLRSAGAGGPESQMPRPLALALAVAVAAALAPWPFVLWVIPTIHPVKISVGTVLVPAAWIGLAVTALAYGYGRALRPAAEPAAQGA